MYTGLTNEIKNKHYSAAGCDAEESLFKAAFQEHQSKINSEIIFDQGPTGGKEASKSSFNWGTFL